MTSFANAFASSDSEKSSPNASDTPSQQFSNIDLDQQQHSSYVSLTDAATFHTDPPATYNSSSRVSPTSVQEFPSNSASALPIDRRISIPDMSKITASSVAAVAPTIDKLKQWSRSTYKCTKQSIYEKLGKTTRTVDVELDNQIEVRGKSMRHQIHHLFPYLAIERNETSI